MGTSAINQMPPSMDPRMMVQSSGQPPKPLPIIDEAINSLSMMSDELGQLYGTLREYIDSTRGVEPPSPNTNLGNQQSPAPGMPRGDMLREKIRVLLQQSQQLRVQINRLHSI